MSRDWKPRFPSPHVNTMKYKLRFCILLSCTLYCLLRLKHCAVVKLQQEQNVSPL